jgi:methyl-accepting chemotaxis protein
MIDNLKIKTLVVSALGFLLMLMVLIGAVGLYSAKHSVALVKDVTLADQKNSTVQTAIRLEMENNRSQILQALQHNPAFAWSQLHDHALTVHHNQIVAISARAVHRWNQYLANISEPEEKRLAQEWYAKSAGLGLESVSAAAAAIKADQWDDAETILIKKINPSYRVGDVALMALTELSEARAKLHDADVAVSVERASYATFAVLLVGVVLGTVVAWLLVRAISGPLDEAMTIAIKVAEGDLTGQIEVHGNNEIGALLKALGKMKSNLAGIVAEVRSSTDTMSSASSEIAAGNMDLSARTADQADSLEKTASSMEQLTGTVKQNSDNAQQANQLAMSASEVATKGGIVVAQVVATMGSINESSKKIVDIIGVIDGIAFQTNILALNAAVEAARAGEHGRGFAVVASEVRNLAQRSAGAAKEIKELIGDSVNKVDSGAKLVDQAGATMQEIVSSIQRVTDIMGEITQASREQTSGLQQINEAISQMDTITQQNVALVEEAAGAAGSLQDQAQALATVVNVFKLDGALQPARPTAAQFTPRGKPVAPVRRVAPSRPVPAMRVAALAVDNSNWEQF